MILWSFYLQEMISFFLNLQKEIMNAVSFQKFKTYTKCENYPSLLQTPSMNLS